MVGAIPTMGLISSVIDWRIGLSRCAVYDFSFFCIYITVLLKAALRPRSLFCCVKGGEANG